MSVFYKQNSRIDILRYGRLLNHSVYNAISFRIISARFIDTLRDEREFEKRVRLASSDIEFFSVTEDVWVFSAANVSWRQHRPHV